MMYLRFQNVISGAHQKTPAQRDFLAGMPAAPQVSANDATFLF